MKTAPFFIFDIGLWYTFIVSMKEEQILRLMGKTAVFIDWANVYNWKKSLKKEPDPKQIFEYLKKYKNIKDINFYYGLDSHTKSKNFLKKIEKIGYNLSTKLVKYIRIKETKIKQRKCDFDIEICMSVYECLEKNFDSFIFFSGDGDFAPMYEYLVKKRKQVIVVFEQGHLGREVYNVNKGLYKLTLSKLMGL